VPIALDERRSAGSYIAGRPGDSNSHGQIVP
jgi:hypothetical protein